MSTPSKRGINGCFQERIKSICGTPCIKPAVKGHFWGWSITEMLTLITLTQTLNSPDVGTLHNRLLALPLFMPGIVA
jgi:hypothetical protein